PFRPEDLDASKCREGVRRSVPDPMNEIGNSPQAVPCWPGQQYLECMTSGLDPPGAGEGQLCRRCAPLGGSGPAEGRASLNSKDRGTVEGEVAVDEESAAVVASRMSRQRRRDTEPEMLVRRELHRRGYRFRVDHPLPGMVRRRGDIVFT